MAGIGFELKKLFQKRGLAATAKAYGYAGVICTGPMLLGIVLLVGIAFICDHTRDQFLLYGRDEIYCGYAV